MRVSSLSTLEQQVERLNKATKENIYLDYDKYNGGYALRNEDHSHYWPHWYRVSAREMTYYLEGQLDMLVLSRQG